MSMSAEIFSEIFDRDSNKFDGRSEIMQLKAAVSVLQDQGDAQARRVRYLERRVESLGVTVSEQNDTIEGLTKAGEDLHLRLSNLWGKVEICEGVLDGR